MLGPTTADMNRTLSSTPSTDGFDAPEVNGQRIKKRASSFPPDTSDKRLGIGGFVLDETFSVVGSKFYDAFYDAWTEPEGASLYTVRVREEPTPQFGARLIVEVGGTKVFQTFLRPNARRTKEAVQQATQRTELYVREYYEPRDVY